jgi:hypothetical protein
MSAAAKPHTPTHVTFSAKRLRTIGPRISVYQVSEWRDSRLARQECIRAKSLANAIEAMALPRAALAATEGQT